MYIKFDHLYIALVMLEGSMHFPFEPTPNL